MNFVVRFCIVALLAAAVVVNGGFTPASTRDTTLTNVNYLVLPNEQSAAKPPKFVHIFGGTATTSSSSGFYGSLALDVPAATLAAPTKTDVAYRLDAPSVSRALNPTASAMIAVGSESSQLYGLAYNLEYSTSEQTFANPTASTSTAFKPYRGAASYYSDSHACSVALYYASNKLQYELYQGVEDSGSDPVLTPECDAFDSASPLIVQPDDRDIQSVYVACGDNSKASLYTINTNSLCQMDSVDGLNFASALRPTAGAHKSQSLYIGGVAADSSVVIEHVALSGTNVGVSSTRQTIASSGEISSMRVAPDGKNLYAGMANGTIMIFDRNGTGSLTYQRSLSTTTNNKVNDIAITDDGKLMFALVNNTVIHVFKDDNKTETPTLYSPAVSAKVSTILDFTAYYPEGAAKASINFYGPSATYTIALQGSAVRSTAGNITLSINTANIAQSASVSSINTAASATSIPENTYTVAFTYEDNAGNTAANASSSGVVIDRTTAAITIYSPTVDGDYYTTSKPISLTYYVPEVPTSGSIKLIFTPLITNPTAITFVLLNTNKTNVTLSINPSSPSATSQIVSVSSNVIADGTYNVTMEYRDYLNNSVATTVGKKVVIDTITLAPAISSPTTGSQNTDFLPFVLVIPESPLANSVKLFVSANYSTTEIGLQLKDFNGTLSFNATGNTNPTSLSNIVQTSNGNVNFTSGIYKFILSYSDSRGNAAVNVTVSDVLLKVTSNNNNNNSSSAHTISASATMVLVLCLLFSILMVLF